MSGFGVNASRRNFLGRSAFLGAAAGSPFVANLLAVGAASAQAADAKSLVCVYLDGGNDQSNTVVPFGPAEFEAYRLARPAIAVPRADLLPLGPIGWSGQPLALNSALAPIKTLFDQQHAALVANVGTLVQPTTRSQWNGGSPLVAVPSQLFSHSDQRGAWQTGLPNRPSATGWLGRMGDLTAPVFNAGSGVSIAMSVGGNNIMQSGSATIQYQLTPRGAVRVRALEGLYATGSGAVAVRRLMSEPRAGLLEIELSRISRRAIEAEALVSAALAGVSVPTAFPGTGIGQQLAMVARMIGARAALGQRRQIFYVSAGGYDFHDNLVADHTLRLRELAEAIAAFYQATEALGVAHSVTTFTASDFGRALQSNGRGADHGWGSHHFVVGGAVKGNRVYGGFPTVALAGPEDAGQGRLIPTLSVDEYAATLARWFGVSDTDMGLVLPNLSRFANRDLGFMG